MGSAEYLSSKWKKDGDKSLAEHAQRTVKRLEQRKASEKSAPLTPEKATAAEKASLAKKPAP